MKIVTVMEKGGLITEEEHRNLEAGTLFCHALYRSEEGPFTLTLYRYRRFRDDTYVSRERMAVWSKLTASPPAFQSLPGDQSRTVASV